MTKHIPLSAALVTVIVAGTFTCYTQALTGLPVRLVVVVLIIGFPALVLAWAFELARLCVRLRSHYPSGLHAVPSS